ncbi:uncharacterized protein GGS22DRAFT_152307 [Annulohypoxylon maeteangense]|uniref:uncharacterized protein n=1 Tax=Annulohypoxylon maeteangense TaxID=1927788 RepID=UPI0020075556|nr:uncharacterized protein GGS22DRAFT_152307 [Annulohypoxylon maeteangense]KAI0888766.1 hypothetical protein GGS22DRAFT_152307 [Annulohypoxylon maeteangense]
MVWAKVSDTRWERPVDGLEGYFVVMANVSASLCEGREHYTLFSKIKLETGSEDVTPALKHAWKQIRYEQPQVATIVDGMKKVYEVPDEKALEEWLESTFVVSPASDAEELYQSVKPIKQASLYYLPKSSELIFRGHHHTLDGTGVLLFWHSYLDALASPIENIRFGDEHARLAPVMEETLGYAEQPTQEQSDKATSLFMSWAAAMPGVGPVSKLGAAPSGRCQNTELVFPTQTTKAIVAACKSKGFSVTAAVHAAYIAAISKHADPESKLAEYVTAAQFNLRPYLPEPYSTSKHAVSVYYTPIPYKVDLPTSFSDIAKSLHEYYQTTFKANAEMLELKGHFTRVLCGAVQTPEFLASPISKDALVSSLGVAERYVQREYGNGIKVTDLKLGVDVVMGMSMFFFYTFRDQLRLVYSFNDGFEEPENIQKYLEEVQTVLVEELLA